MNFSNFLLLVSLFKSVSLYSEASNPKLNYETAFNQAEIYQTHAELLIKLGVYKHLEQAGVVPQKKVEFPWDEYQSLNFYNQYKNGRTFFVPDDANKKVYAIEDENEIAPWDRMYGECYPFPWGHYHILKEARRKEIKTKYHGENDLNEAYRQGRITKEEYYEEIYSANDPKQFEQDCIDQLELERSKALYGPAAISLLSSIASVTIAWLSASFGNSSIFHKKIQEIGAGLSLFSLKGTVEPIPSLIWPPDNPLKDLEEKFAKNKYSIPPALWPQIIKTFMLARDDVKNRQKHIDFLHFALNFTIYKPKPKIQCSNNRSITEVKNELDARIDNFFKDYEDKDGNRKNTPHAKNKLLDHIKLNISKFIDSLNSKEVQAPSYLYLHGPGGIGKTHFVQELVQWIDELMPNSVGFENIKIDSAEKLEGSSEKSGIFVDVLHNQLAQNQIGSVVFIDEACSSLNNSSMIGAIKRAFNEDGTILSASCFGTSINGPVKLNVPPMLVIFAGNDAIHDKPFMSRTVMINFLHPNTSALAKEALATIQKSNALVQKNYPTNIEEIIYAWIQKLPAEHRNFRYVKKNIEVELPTLISSILMKQDETDKVLQ